MCKTTGQYNKFKLTQIQSSKRICMSYAVKVFVIIWNVFVKRYLLDTNTMCLFKCCF